MLDFSQMKAAADAQQKAINDLMNATLSRCFAAYISNGQSPTEAMDSARNAVQVFANGIGLKVQGAQNGRPSGESSKEDSGNIVH